MKKNKINFLLAAIFFIAFIILTALVLLVDVQPIGPLGSEIGLASINSSLLLPYNPVWDAVSDVASAFALLVAGVFAFFGLWQWLGRKSLKKVDPDLFALAGFYFVLALVYVLFEIVVVNYRPILMDGVLEASYPSSHTVLVYGILLTAIMQFKKRIQRKPWCILLTVLCSLMMVLVAVGRIFAGVHWCTDVLSGILLSGALAFCYSGISNLLIRRTR